LIWIVLVLAIVAVLVAKNADRKDEPANRPAAIEAAVIEPDGVAAGNQEKALPRLLDLGAGKCVPCKAMEPILEDLKTTCAGKLEVQFIDVWENPDAGEKYGINLIPTQIFYDAAGNELFRHEGFFARDDILAKWQELGVDLTSQE
jgi:thioredoxin 1